MKHYQQKRINNETITMLKKLVLISGLHPPSYATTIEQLNTLGYTTSRGNLWTAHRLFRMLQRNKIGGLYGLRKIVQSS